MDLIGHLLARIHSHEGVLHRTVLQRPFGLRIDERASLGVVICPDVEAWVWFDGDEPTLLPAGQIAVLATPEPYTFADSPGASVRYLIRPDGASLLDGTLLEPALDDVNCLVEQAGDSVVISGNYDVSAGLGDRLLAALPRVAVIDLPEWPALLGLLTAALAGNRPGRQVLLDRWLDLVLVSALRTWFEHDQNAPGWYAARHDPVIGPALNALHAEPEAPWTTGRLAQLVTSSRSAFSARFTRLVGEPPMTYLTRLRIDLTTERLLTDDAPLESIAASVGYANAFALSAAYKRHTGISPSQVRCRVS